MNYIIISDSHSNKEKIKFLLKKYKGYTFIHCGDYEDDMALLDEFKVKYVKGNCDYKGPHELILNINDKKTLVTHGDKYNVKFKLDNIYYKALESECSLVLFGHTHQPLLEENSGITFVNPGALKNDYYALIEDDKIKLRKI